MPARDRSQHRKYGQLPSLSLVLFSYLTGQVKGIFRALLLVIVNNRKYIHVKQMGSAKG